MQQQRPESPTVTLTWHACKYKVRELHQRYILNWNRVCFSSKPSLKLPFIHRYVSVLCFLYWHSCRVTMVDQRPKSFCRFHIEWLSLSVSRLMFAWQRRDFGESIHIVCPCQIKGQLIHWGVYRWWSYVHCCSSRAVSELPTVADSGLCCCVHVTLN